MLRKGITTSEFWLTVVYALIVVANGTVYVNISDVKMAALAALLGVYAGGRSLGKSSELKASTDISSLAAKVKKELS